jgi:hypothetical protein
METPPKRLYKTFVHKEAVFRIHCNQHEIVSELVRQAGIWKNTLNNMRIFCIR